MKKKVFAILLIALVSQVFNIFASAYNEEIMFRGIPWGSSFFDVIEMLTGDGVDTDDIFYSSTIPDFTFEIDVPFENVAGYRATATLCFINPDEEIHNYKSEHNYLPEIKGLDENAILYNASYKFRFDENFLSRSNLDKLVDEICSKLKKVYGNSSKGENEYADYSYTWKGTNGTKVNLVVYYYSDKSYSINLRYEWAEGYDILKHQYDIKDKEEIERKQREAKEYEEFLSNVNGL